MKMTTVTYHKVFNLGDFENEKISLEATLEEGESHVEAIATLKAEVQKAHEFSSELKRYIRAQQVANDPMNHRGFEVAESQEFIKEFESRFPEHIEAFKAKNGSKLIKA